MDGGGVDRTRYAQCAHSHRAPVSERASKLKFGPYSYWAQIGLEAIMALYEFRLLDADGKLNATRLFEKLTDRSKESAR